MLASRELRIVALLSCLLVYNDLRADDDKPFRIQVKYQNKPVPGAKVRGLVGRQPNTTPNAVLTDKDGFVTMNLDGDAHPVVPWHLFAEDDQGRLGYSVVRGGRVENITIELQDTTTMEGQIVTEANAPIANATITLSQLTSPNRKLNRMSEPAQSFDIPAWCKKRYSTSSDASGKFRLTGVMAGYHALCNVQAKGYGTCTVRIAPQQANSVVLLPAGKLQFQINKGRLSDLEGMRYRIYQILELGKSAETENLQTDTRIRLWTKETTDEWSDMRPGSYEIVFQPSLEKDFTVPRYSGVKITAGQTTPVVLIREPAATIEGTVIDKQTRQGVPHLEVTILSGFPATQLGNVLTNDQGEFKALVPAGRKLMVKPAPDIPSMHHSGNIPHEEYAYDWERLRPRPTSANRHYVDAEVHFRGQEVRPLGYGEVRNIEPLEMVKAVTLEGTVVNESGQPVPHAEIYLAYTGVDQPRLPWRADAQGRFKLEGFPPVAQLPGPRVRSGSMVNIPIMLDLTVPQQPMHIILSDKHGGTIHGKVLDRNDRLIDRPEINIFHYIRMDKRERLKESGAYWSPRQHVRTDGTFQMDHLWLNDMYALSIKTENAGGYRKDVKLEKAVLDVGVFRMTRLNAQVRGKVIDSKGQPLTGVKLSQQGDGPRYTETSSAADGSFTLDGFSERRGFVFAWKAGYQWSFVLGQPDGPAVTMTLHRQDEPPGYLPQRPGYWQVEQDRLHRHLLERLWSKRMQLGNARNQVFMEMYRFDPQQAKNWLVTTVLSKEDANELGMLIKHTEMQVRISKAAKADMDGLLTEINQLPPASKLEQLIHLAHHLIVIDPERASKLIAETCDLIGVTNPVAPLWQWAVLYHLAEKTRNTQASRKIKPGLYHLADYRYSDMNHRSQTGGNAALAMLDHDRPLAIRLAGGTGQTGENGRYAHFLLELARHDLSAAKELIAFSPMKNSPVAVSFALFIAETDPQQAEAMIDAITSVPLRCRGYSLLAVKLASRKQQAWALRLMTRARSLIEEYENEFKQSGGRTRYALALACDAKRMAHPQAIEFIIWALRQRPATNSTSFSIAGVSPQEMVLLSLLDPQLTRQLLSTTTRNTDDRELSNQLHGITALAVVFADPSLAIRLIDHSFSQPQHPQVFFRISVEAYLHLHHQLAREQYQELHQLLEMPYIVESNKR